MSTTPPTSPAPTEKLRMQLSPDGRRVQVVIEPQTEVIPSSSDVLEQLNLMGYGDWESSFCKRVAAL